MASSSCSLSRRLLTRSLFSNPPRKSHTTTTTTNINNNSNLYSRVSYCTNSSRNASDVIFDRPAFLEYPLEKGLDYGIYKAILVGQVGQKPVQKKLRNGSSLTMLSVGTGGIRNIRTPLENEDPKDYYVNQCSVQWHRVTIYSEKLGDVAMNHVTPGSILYLEGSLETKVFSDPISGIFRRVREVAIRRHGRLVFLGQGSNCQMSSDLKRVGYF